MIGPGLAGASFDAYAYNFDSGLEGLITVTIEDADGNVIVAPTTANIIEIDAGGIFSVYRYAGIYPAVLGDYILIWEDPDGLQAAEELVVAFEISAVSTGPSADSVCQLWTTVEDVAACCSVDLSSDNAGLFDTAVLEASSLLNELSGNQFSGLCVRRVRPCPGRCGCWSLPAQAFATTGGLLDGSTIGGVWGGGFGSGRSGCKPLSSVKLSGFPVRAILKVEIDDVVIAPSEYRLDRHRDLVRLNDADGKPQRWPGCQDMGKASGEDTFFVTYLYGVAPPTAGVEAAKQLACELVKACPDASGDAGECDLPAGTVQMVRQGLTVNAQTLGLFLTQGGTGLTHVDAFLGVYGRASRRRAVIWSPDVAPYAQEA